MYDRTTQFNVISLAKYKTDMRGGGDERTLCIRISRRTWSSLSSVRGAAYMIAQTASDIEGSGSCPLISR
jgi:hypothetical protein